MTKTIPNGPVKCVRIASNGEVNGFTQLYATYNLPADHEIFTSGEVSEVSKLLGMPLLLAKLRPSLTRVRERKQPSKDRVTRFIYGYGTEGDYYPNDIAATLMISCDASNTSVPLLQPPGAWMDRVGSILVARADHKDLHPEELERLIEFIVQIIFLTKQDFERQGQTITPAELLSALTVDNFLQFRQMQGESDLVAATEASEGSESMDWDI